MRREREIRTQQLLEVSQYLAPNFLHVCLDLVVSFTQKKLFSYSIWDTYVFLYFVHLSCVSHALSVCVVFIYIYIYILSPYIYIHLSIYTYYTISFNEYSCIEKLSYTIYPFNNPLTTPIVPGHMRHL